MPSDPLSHHLYTMALQNAWANHRLLNACARLAPGEFTAPRASFFGSIKATLNHILTVDWFYVDALEREARGDAAHPNVKQFFEPPEPFETCAPLQAEQALIDRRLIDYCASLHDRDLAREVAIERPTQTQRETRTRLLAHLFEHQIHHRGQVHDMLSATSVKPPQLDEFFCELDAPLRAEEFAALGFRETEIWG